MEAALDELKADVEEWMAVTDGNSCWEVYPNEQGTLFVGHYSGTTRGSTAKMVQVSRTGEQVDLPGGCPAIWPPILHPGIFRRMRRGVISHSMPSLEEGWTTGLGWRMILPTIASHLT